MIEPYYQVFDLTYLGDTVLDPFMGTGTTAWVAKKFHRKCIGIEISEEYCHIAATPTIW